MQNTRDTQQTLDKKQVPFTLTTKEMALFERIVERHLTCETGQVLCQAGDTVNAIYIVLSGSFEGSIKSNEEQLNSLFATGEVIGLDSLGQRSHKQTVIARENAEVCELPLDELEALAVRMPSLRKQFVGLLSDNIQST